LLGGIHQIAVRQLHRRTAAVLHSGGRGNVVPRQQLEFAPAPLLQEQLADPRHVQRAQVQDRRIAWFGESERLDEVGAGVVSQRPAGHPLQH
jgi:hypothetical protein